METLNSQILYLNDKTVIAHVKRVKEQRQTIVWVVFQVLGWEIMLQQIHAANVVTTNSQIHFLNVKTVMSPAKFVMEQLHLIAITVLQVMTSALEQQ